MEKKYSELNQVINQIYAEEGVTMRQSVSSWGYMPRYFCKIQKKMKFEKSGINCPEDEDTIPADSSLWPASGVTYWHLNGDWFEKDGTQARISTGYKSLSAKMIDGTTVLYYCGNKLLIDVNGEKKPNIIGRDIYGFGIKAATNKTYLPGTSTTEYWPGCMANAYDYVYEGTYKEDCENGSGWGCSALYLAE